MAIDTSAPRSRRTLLAAALGAGVATIASALGRPLPARAADDAPVLVGGEYTATSVTKLTNATNSAAVLHGASHSGTGIVGESKDSIGVQGESVSDTGVEGFSDTGAGVFGHTNSGTGVAGWSSTGFGASFESETEEGAIITGRTGLIAYANGDLAIAKTGVVGLSTVLPEQLITPAKTGVFGWAPADSACRGVYGRAAAGRGVHGEATTGTGLYGSATTGIAGYFASTDPTKGYALRAIGRVRLDKCAGVATILTGANSVVVTPGIDLTSSSAVVATLQGTAGSATTTVSRCYVNSATNKFTVYLTAKATQNVRVAWHVFG